MLKKHLLNNKEIDMGNNFIPTFWGAKDMDKFLIGFDEQFSRLQKFHDDMTKNIPNYPPYNIIKIDENHYTIELAVAGFGQSDIDIEMENGKLTVRGNIKADEAADNFLFRGIANRAFTRAFALNDEVEVKNAELFNGMLKIFLERLVPEQRKPKKIAVKAGKTLSQEEQHEIAERL
jgi:molecular chaperone IbpA